MTMRALMPTASDPALGLDKREIALVRAYAETGNVVAAARVAGWNPSTAQGALRKPKLAAAVLFESQRRMVTGAPVAVSTIIELAGSAVSEKVRLEASKFLIEQNLGKALERVQLEVALPAEEKELLDRIGELARDLGLRTIDVTPDAVRGAADSEPDTPAPAPAQVPVPPIDYAAPDADEGRALDAPDDD